MDSLGSYVGTTYRDAYGNIGYLTIAISTIVTLPANDNLKLICGASSPNDSFASELTVAPVTNVH
jgi:hypothetical protein